MLLENWWWIEGTDGEFHKSSLYYPRMFSKCENAQIVLTVVQFEKRGNGGCSLKL